MRGAKAVSLGTLIALGSICAGCFTRGAPSPAHARTSDPDARQRTRVCQAPSGPAPRANLAVTTADPPEGETIAAISIEGARTVPKQLVNRSLTLTVGSRFDSERADADLLRILALGPFEDVRFLTERRPQGIALHVQLDERPVIRKVFLADGSSQPEQGEWTPVLQGDPYDPLALERVVRVLEKTLVAEGHLDAKTAVRASRVDEGQVDVCVQVERGPEWKIEQIEFPGARMVTAEEMLTQIGSANQPGHAYRAEPLKIDILRMNALLYDHGLLQCKVGSPRIHRLASSHGLRIEIPVEEGKVFRIGKVRVSGDLAGPRPGYERELGTLSGRTFSRSQMMEVVERLRKHHHKLARSAQSDVIPSLDMHESDGTVDVVFKVEGR